jgi:hypothetical protein
VLSRLKKTDGFILSIEPRLVRVELSRAHLRAQHGRSFAMAIVKSYQQSFEMRERGHKYQDMEDLV